MPTTTVQSAAEVQQLFNRIAPHYDQLNQWLSLGLHQIWKTMTVDWTDPFPGSTVLDLCCGTGDLAHHLARRVGREGKVYGLDFSVAVLQIAKQRAQLYYPGHSFIWLEGDALALPFADNTFAAVTMGYGLRNVTDIPGCLKEILRVLKPGGKAAILDFQHPTDPGVQAFQSFYLDRIVVPSATILGLASEYAYIKPSLEAFPTGSEQLRLTKSVGFGNAKFYPLVGGMMGVLRGEKFV